MSYYTHKAQYRVVNGVMRTYTMIHTINLWQRFTMHDDLPKFKCKLFFLFYFFTKLFFKGTDHLFSAISLELRKHSVTLTQINTCPICKETFMYVKRRIQHNEILLNHTTVILN